MARTSAPLPIPESARTPSPIAALERLLEELATTVMELDRETYTARPAAPVSGSVGEHVRHALDHVAALLAADPTRPLSYDHRERGTMVETDPPAALRQLFRLRAALPRWTARALETPVAVRSQVSDSGECVSGWSTFGRELAFVVSHTIHHQAMIAVLLAMLDVEVGDRFGFAPSTPAAG